MKLLTLDINIWEASSNIIMYTFFEKKKFTNQVLHKETALPDAAKISSLTAEVSRRMTSLTRRGARSWTGLPRIW